jgi:uncharacterized protein (UPF0335 family)
MALAMHRSLSSTTTPIKRLGPNIMADEVSDSSQAVAAGQLRSFIERIERLEEEKKALADDIKEVYAECKGTGFDVKAVRQLIRIRKQDKAEREEAEAILDLYMNALGM